MKYNKYKYQEIDKDCKLIITFLFDKFKEESQDNIFNDLIRLISNIELKSTLTNSDINNINNFLRLAKHSIGLDIEYFIKKLIL